MPGEAHSLRLQEYCDEEAQANEAWGAGRYSRSDSQWLCLRSSS